MRSTDRSSIRTSTSELVLDALESALLNSMTAVQGQYLCQKLWKEPDFRSKAMSWGTLMAKSVQPDDERRYEAHTDFIGLFLRTVDPGMTVAAVVGPRAVLIAPYYFRLPRGTKTRWEHHLSDGEKPNSVVAMTISDTLAAMFGTRPILVRAS